MNRRFFKKQPYKQSKKDDNNGNNSNNFVLTEEYCKMILEKSAYIGQQGFTIIKADMHIEDLQQIRKLLMIETTPSFSGPKTEIVSFPVFRENDKKIYIPRFYGETRYNGKPTKYELSIGDPISVPFVKPIRDYQEKIVQVYMDHVTNEKNISGGGILEVPCGRGKCLGKDTPIIMYDGSIKLVQNIIIGDLLMGDDSTPRKVLSLARGKERMYKIRETKHSYITKEECIGEEYIVNESHILSLYLSNNEKIYDISVRDFLTLPNHIQKKLLGYRVPIIFQEKPVEADPYIIGFYCNILPLQYKCNCPKIQLELFAGIIDAIGEFHLPNLIKIKKQNLQKDILFLSRSLGFKLYQTKTYIFIQLQYGKYKIPFRKNENIEKQNKIINTKPNYLNENKEKIVFEYNFSIERKEIDDYYGFEIDGNRRFMLGDFTVTHNTVMALKLISMIERKTLIIVHKEFLMNQWIERIAEFIPSARVGKIQGPKFDIEEKDIVIGMIQSMYDRSFPSNAFSSFGFTIVDEVHRIASEEFSKTLFKTITNCMLGISATVDRKDGLTNVLHMFIGPKIYSEERKDEDIVEVRAIEYKHFDDEYNEVAYDYMGNVAHTTMISKISNFPPRCDFVVRILRDLIKENPEKQIMVLSQIRGLLTSIHEKLEGLDVGFYVGGMKQKDLQETEEKQIVLATYAMAAEALDIKTLNTLVMVSPKTDIIQSVGRILRTRGLGKLIVDIIDTHDVFQNQWKKRKTYYKKCGYGISYVKSDDYKNENKTIWKRISEAVVCNKEDDEKPKCMIDISKMDFERII
jgi:superfamily II DNA or RNA helicase